MKKIYCLLISVLLSSCSKTIICNNPDTLAGPNNSFLEFLVSACWDGYKGEWEISTFTYNLTIGKKGEIINVESCNKKCKIDSVIKSSLFYMPKWKPAYKNGRAVTSNFLLHFTAHPQ